MLYLSIDHKRFAVNGLAITPHFASRLGTLHSGGLRLHMHGRLLTGSDAYIFFGQPKDAEPGTLWRSGVSTVSTKLAASRAGDPLYPPSPQPPPNPATT